MALLDRIEAGEIALWPNVDQELNHPTGTETQQTAIQSEISSTPGWRYFDQETKGRLNRAMASYLESAAAEVGTLLINGRDALPLIACRAFAHLALEDRAMLDQLAPERWQAWAPALIASVKWFMHEIDPWQTTVLRLVFDRARSEAVRASLDLIDQTLSQPTSHWQAIHVGEMGDPSVLDHLEAWLERPISNPNAIGPILDLLFKHRPQRTGDHVAAIIATPRMTAEDRKRTLALVVELLQARPTEAWPWIKPLFAADAAFAADAWLAYANDHRLREGTVLAELPPAERVAICVQLHQLFPPDEDLRHDDGPYSPEPRDDVAHLRDGMVQAFAASPSTTDIDALNELVQQLPERKELRLVRRSAIANRQAAMYRWLTPGDLRQLLSTRGSRLVRSNDELLRVCMESLERFQSELRTFRPKVRRLWNEGPECRPKDEAAFTDEIADFLSRDLAKSGIIANREVEIRSRIGQGGASGERTDILVQVRDPLTGEIFQVVIEAKGCWNPGILDDMDKQLARRYLSERSCAHGIYLVGWFLCPQWVDEDRRRITEKLDLATLPATLEKQARSLSATLGVTICPKIIDARLP